MLVIVKLSLLEDELYMSRKLKNVNESLKGKGLGQILFCCVYDVVTHQ